ncbi:unnamed protein product [Hydatigera taeniaeformis]|uniref:PDZ domain-containing protein n=1 Tax=Hydatigena taeniaeformis TaxID=6205 RepID=A0A0R3WS33_HYDTA|nr:unnamed protein product [Hydatigera taeniaeformis]
MPTALSSTSAKSRDVVNIVIPRGPIGFEFSIKSNEIIFEFSDLIWDQFRLSALRLVVIDLPLPLGPHIVISKVREGGTAELAGLKCGSILQAVNRQPIDGLSFLQVSNMIRRTSGFTAELSVIEPDEVSAVSGNGDSLVPSSTSSSRCSIDGVVLRNSHSNPSATSLNCSISSSAVSVSCAFPNRQKFLQSSKHCNAVTCNL